MPPEPEHADTAPLDIALRHMRIANGDEFGATGVLLKLACVSKAHRDKVVRWSRRKARATGETPAAVRAALARTAAFWESGGLYDRDRDGRVVESALEYVGYGGGHRAFVRACVAASVRPDRVAARMRTLKTLFGATSDDGFRVGVAIEAGAFDADFRLLNFFEESDAADATRESPRLRELKTRFAWNAAVACENLPLPGSVPKMLGNAATSAFVERAARDCADGCAPLRLRLWIEVCCGEVLRRMERLALVKRTRPGTYAKKHSRERADLRDVHSRLTGR